MSRLLFEKTGRSVWISHLDLMRLFQRAFKRAGLQLTHTQGYNPRPSVSIALPLSVGVESNCELLDFDLDGEPVDADEIREKLNLSLVEGITVLEVYDTGRKIRDLTLLDCSVFMEYDNGIPFGAEETLRTLFSARELIVPKKTKSGIQDQNIIPMIRDIKITGTGGEIIEIRALVCCQNPTLNPLQLVAAVERYVPDLKPDFARCKRNEIYDNDRVVFR